MNAFVDEIAEGTYARLGGTGSAEAEGWGLGGGRSGWWRGWRRFPVRRQNAPHAEETFPKQLHR